MLEFCRETNGVPGMLRGCRRSLLGTIFAAGGSSEDWWDGYRGLVSLQGWRE